MIPLYTSQVNCPFSSQRVFSASRNVSTTIYVWRYRIACIISFIDEKEFQVIISSISFTMESAWIECHSLNFSITTSGIHCSFRSLLYQFMMSSIAFIFLSSIVSGFKSRIAFAITLRRIENFICNISLKILVLPCDGLP